MILFYQTVCLLFDICLFSHHNYYNMFPVYSITMYYNVWLGHLLFYLLLFSNKRYHFSFVCAIVFQSSFTLPFHLLLNRFSVYYEKSIIITNPLFKEVITVSYTHLDVYKRQYQYNRMLYKTSKMYCRDG